MADPMSPPPLKASRAAKATANPIRAIVDHLKVDPENKLSYIPLSIGDPTLDGNLLPPSNFIDKIAEVSKAHKHDGYPPAIGYVDARNAVASFYGPRYIRGGPKGSLPAPSAADVVLASGASHALEMVIQASLNPGDTLLLPAPCFSLYSVICANRGINVAHYCLDGAKQWAADLDSLERAMNPTVKAILINNPSNPCGSNFSKENLEGQLRFAEKHNLLVIADEIYAGLVFDIRECDGAPRPTFVSVGALTDRVPCLIIGGIAKAYVVPGYRLGWVIRHDPRNLAADVWQGVQNVAALILGANSLMQAALNNLLNETPQSYSEGLRTTLRDHAKLCVDYLSHADGVAAVVPQGAMYILVRIAFDRFPPSSGITNDTQFAAALLRVKNVAVLPGTIFQAPGYIRLVFTKPADQLKDALARIVDFTKECTAAR